MDEIADVAGIGAARSSVAGLDLHLDRVGGRVRDGVMDAIRDAIRLGRLVPGTRLPSSRALAADLGVARNTVARAYAELIAEGRLTSQHGSGHAWSLNGRARLCGPSPRRLRDGRRADWTTTCGLGIRTCRRFRGQRGAARSSAR